MVVGHLLAHRLVEHLLELGQVTAAGHWKDALHHSVVLFHRHPAVTDEEEPANVTRHIGRLLAFNSTAFCQFLNKRFAVY